MDLAADRHPLVHERRERHAPALADVAEPFAVGHAHVGEVHLVELGLAGRLHAAGGTSTPGACMSTTNIVMPLCFGCSGSVRTITMPKRARCASVVHTFWPLTTHSSPSRTVRVERPADVGARAGLAEHLAPDLLAGEQRAQVAALLLVAAVGHDRRRAHAVTDRVAAVRERCARGGHPRVHHVLQLGRHAESAEALGEVHPRRARRRTPRRAPRRGGSSWDRARRAARRSGRSPAARRSSRSAPLVTPTDAGQAYGATVRRQCDRGESPWPRARPRRLGPMRRR